MNMLQIIIPSNNIEERAYIIHVLISDFLGLPYELIISEECQDYILFWKNKRIVITDAFFNKYKKTLTYLDYNNLPKKLIWFTQLEEKIPIIYGENILMIEADNILCGLDIFGSSFFMLSRWEEIVIEKKDIYGRCDESEMFVVKHNIFDIPFVCDYCMIIRKLLLLLDHGLETKTIRYTPLITHDVDYLFRYGSLFSLGQNLAGDILHRKSFRTANLTVKSFIQFRKGRLKDPFDTFDELMNISEKFNLKSSFYFLPSIINEKDYSYSIFDKRVINIIKNINNRGHEVGIHPSRNTFHNGDQFKIEYERLASLGFPIFGGRQHFLLYDVSESFSYWEEMRLDYDSGMGFYERAGFRSGVCWPYRIFDIKNRKVLNLCQKPLCVMDTALIRWNPSPDKLFHNILKILNLVKKHSGLFVFLWHNDGFYRPECIDYKEVYKEVMKLV